MHQLGVHLKAVAHSSSMGEVMLSDRPYDRYPAGTGSFICTL
jgi:hypothetical protein